MQLPESYRKFEQTYDVIISTIQKPFNNFKEKADMVSMSQFCKSITEVLPKYRPAVSLKIYLNLETLASIIGDESIVKCVNAEKREKSMEELINVLGNHPEISRYVPEAITNLFNELKLSFNSDHVRQFAKIAFKLQDATNLARLFCPSILEHLPECNDDELVEIMSQLGIFGEPFRVIVHEPVRDSIQAFAKKEVRILQGAAKQVLERASPAPMAYHAAPMEYHAAPMRKCALDESESAIKEKKAIIIDQDDSKDYEDDESDEERASEEASESGDEDTEDSEDSEDIMDTWN